MVTAKLETLLSNPGNCISRSCISVPGLVINSSDIVHSMSGWGIRLTLATLRSGHNRLNAHMHTKLNIVPSPTCPCGEEDQTTEHVLQRCNIHQPERIAQWPSATPLHQKLYGGLEDLKKTTNFITDAGLVV